MNFNLRSASRLPSRSVTSARPPRCCLLPAMLAADAKLKEDYDVIVAAARRQRK